MHRACSSAQLPVTMGTMGSLQLCLCTVILALSLTSLAHLCLCFCWP